MASAASGGPLLADEEDVVEDTLGRAEADAAEDARQTGAKTHGTPSSKSASKRTRKTAEEGSLEEGLAMTNEFLRKFVANPPSAPVQDQTDRKHFGSYVKASLKNMNQDDFIEARDAMSAYPH